MVAKKITVKIIANTQEESPIPIMLELSNRQATSCGAKMMITPTNTESIKHNFHAAFRSALSVDSELRKTIVCMIKYTDANITNIMAYPGSPFTSNAITTRAFKILYGNFRYFKQIYSFMKNTNTGIMILPSTSPENKDATATIKDTTYTNSPCFSVRDMAKDFCFRTFS